MKKLPHDYQKTSNMVARGPAVPKAAVTRVKTDGRIGSVTPPSYLKGGFTVDNNQKAGPPGKLGSKAASHMSPGHKGGSQWSPRVAKSRKMVAGGDKGRPHTNPINWAVKGLRPLKPT